MKTRQIFSIDKDIKTHHNTFKMAKGKAKPGKLQRVILVPNDEDNAIIDFGKRKHGLTAVDIVRMALRRFAEAEGLELKAS